MGFGNPDLLLQDVHRSPSQRNVSQLNKMSLQIFQDNINAKLAAFRDEGWPFIEVEVMREGCGKASS